MKTSKLFPAACAAFALISFPAYAFIGQSLAFTAGEMSTPHQQYEMKHAGCNMDMIRSGLTPKVQILREQVQAAELLNVPQVKAALLAQLNERIMKTARHNGCTHEQAANLIVYFQSPLETAAIETLPPSAQ